jgi:hypothetical protein
MDSKYLSIKHSSYFQVYEDLLLKYVDKKIIFVEIGVLNGGSLFMWRNFLGPNARIIGIDFNPDAKKWEKDGCEIYVGSQSDPLFWRHFFDKMGPVDVILDDGGHTNEQQILTVENCVPNIKDGGMLILEDVHTSYFRDFGNPSRYSFINYTKNLIDSINSRFPRVHASKNLLNKMIYSLTIYESIVVFHINRIKCFESVPVTNNGISSDAQDFRYNDSKVKIVFQLQSFLKKFDSFSNIPFFKSLGRYIFDSFYSINYRIRSIKLRKYFK